MIKILTTATRTHLTKVDAYVSPHFPHGQSGTTAACGREVIGYAGTADVVAAVTCKGCQRTAEFKAAERRPRVIDATAYVTSRFYPPLPAAYGELAVTAVDRVLADDDTPIVIPTHVAVTPRAAVTRAGVTTITPLELIYALKLEHMVDDYADDVA